MTAGDDSSAAPEDPALLAELEALAERAARAAGDLVRQRPERVVAAATKTTPTDVVTAMDLAAEELLAGTLAQARPDDGLLGEEGGLRPGTSGLTWVVDPLDGTVNYLYGLRDYAVSVAVVAGGGADPSGRVDPSTWRALAGCVHNPVSGETWTAHLGGGARLDGRALPPVVDVPMERALVGTGFGYAPERRRAQARVLVSLLPRVRDVRRIGSSALDLCAVASGRLDAYYEWGLYPWDQAAGALVVTEAGGAVLGATSPARDDGEPTAVVAAAPRLAAALEAEVARLRAEA